METNYTTKIGLGGRIVLTDEGREFLAANYESHTNEWIKQQLGICDNSNYVLKRLLSEAKIKHKRVHLANANKKYVTIVEGRGIKAVLNERGRKYLIEHRHNTKLNDLMKTFGVFSVSFKRHLNDVCREMGVVVERAKRRRRNDGRDEELKTAILAGYQSKSVCELSHELHASIKRIRSLMYELHVYNSYKRRIHAKNKALMLNNRSNRFEGFNFKPKKATKKVTQKESVLLTAKEKKVLGVKSLKGIESQADIIKKFDTIVRNEEWRLEVSKGIKLYATFYLRDKGREKAIRERYGKEYEYRLTRIEKHEGQGQGADGAA